MAVTELTITPVVSTLVVDTPEQFTLTVTTDPAVELLEMGVIGPTGAIGATGATGPQGPAGVGGDLTYVHTQVGASTSWVVVHNLGKYPAITVIDSGGNVVYGDIDYDSVNQVTISFATAFSGTASAN